MAKSPSLDGFIVDTTVMISETTIAHNLGRTALEVFVLQKGTSAIVFRGSTAWNSTNVFLQASAAVHARLLII